MISNIRLQNFRSYLDSSFEFDDGVNIIVGPNASGKTNLLESIAFITQGKSFRSKDTETVMIGKDWSRIDGYVSGSTRSVKLVSEDMVVQKNMIVDGKEYRRLSRQNRLPVVVFEPNHLLLLHGSPDGRRVFIDTIIEHSVAEYGKVIRDYKKTLAQRNALLKLGKKDANQMFVWNVRLSEQGGSIVQSRLKMLRDISDVISDLYSGVVGKRFEVGVHYLSECRSETYSSSMLKLLEANEERDYLRGFTAYGPHRDDIEITIDGKQTSRAASRGEARSMLLALKMFELNNIETWLDEEPILLLDDVFSELDGARRRALTEYVQKYQSFITTTDADMVIEHIQTANTIALG